VAIDTNDGSPTYSLRGRVENFEAGQASAAVFGATVLAGRSALVLDVASHGETPAQVMRRLSGKASLAMPEGGRLALDIKALRGAVTAEARGSGWERSAGARPASTGGARAMLRDGVLVVCRYGQGAAGSIGLGAVGQVDIVDGRLDLNVAVKPNVPTDRPLTSATWPGVKR
jgi:hypothetical protein